MEQRMENKNRYIEKIMVMAPGTDEKGSVIVIALMVLLLMSLGGISATNMSVTESFIVRNSAIHKQNLMLAEMAALEGFRWILTQNDEESLRPGAEIWLRDETSWNNNPTVNDPNNDDNFPLTDDNSAVAFGILEARSNTIAQRGETDDVLRYYFIGWRDAPQSSLKMTETTWREGRVIGIYNSERNGLASVEIGVVKRF